MTDTLIDIPQDTEFGALATPERVNEALAQGGRAVVTIRSHRTQQHLTIAFAVRKRDPENPKRFISRAKLAGRVGMADGDVIEARDPVLEYPDNYIGRFYLNTGEWRAGRDADGARVWAAERVLTYALAGRPLRSEVFLATQCSFCGKQLTDPVSVERGVGPECFGLVTGSRVVPHA